MPERYVYEQDLDPVEISKRTNELLEKVMIDPSILETLDVVDIARINQILLDTIETEKNIDNQHLIDETPIDIIKKQRFNDTGNRQEHFIITDCNNFADDIDEFKVKKPFCYIVENQKYNKIYINRYVYNTVNLVPIPNKYAKQETFAIKLDGKIIGHIKKGNFAHIKNLLEDNRIASMQVIIRSGSFVKTEYDDLIVFDEEKSEEHAYYIKHGLFGMSASTGELIDSSTYTQHLCAELWLSIF